MTELPLDQSIPRFKTNENRFDRFINGGNTDTFTTSTDVVIPSVAKFLKDKDDAINVAANGILAETVEAKGVAVAAAGAAAQSAQDAALFDPSSYYTKSESNSAYLGKTESAVNSEKLDGQEASDYRDATKLTGVISSAQLPARLREAAQGNAYATDWNDAIASGWYMGDAASLNSPTATYYVGIVTAYSTSWVTQTVHQMTSDGASDTKIYRRSFDTGVWSPWYRLRISEAEIKALISASSIGVAQTWQDVTASRAKDTSYQNVTGKPIQLAVQARGASGVMEISTDNANWVSVGRTAGLTNGYFSNIHVIVPNGHYYRLSASDVPNKWAELR